MYSWKTIRTFCVGLLILPLIHLVILVSRDTVASLDSSPEVWQDEMDAYIRGDGDVTLPESPIVVFGGRRVALWQGLDAVTAPNPVLVRALGNATVEDLTHYHERLVAFYQPRVAVLLPGNSEFRIRDSKSADDLIAAIQHLVQLDNRHDEGRLFYVIAPIKTTLYPEDHAKIDRVNRTLEDWADGQTRLRVIDPNPMLAGAGGGPDGAYFRSDGVLLNDAGYLRLGFLLRQQLSADFPQDYPINAGNRGSSTPQMR